MKPIYADYSYFFWTPWAVNQYVVPWFERELARKFPDEYRQLFNAITTPTKRIMMDRQFMGIAGYQARQVVAKKMTLHIRKYGLVGSVQPVGPSMERNISVIY